MILDLFRDYEAVATEKGYPNDLALAMVSGIALNLHVYEGKTEKPILAFEINLGRRDEVAEYATDRGTFNSLSDRQKQELYELFIMLGGLTYRLYEKALAEKNAEEIKGMRVVAEQNLKILRSFRLNKVVILINFG